MRMFNVSICWRLLLVQYPSLQTLSLSPHSTTPTAVQVQCDEQRDVCASLEAECAALRLRAAKGRKGCVDRGRCAWVCTCCCWCVRVCAFLKQFLNISLFVYHYHCIPCAHNNLSGVQYDLKDTHLYSSTLDHQSTRAAQCIQRAWRSSVIRRDLAGKGVLSPRKVQNAYLGAMRVARAAALGEAKGKVVCG